MLYQLMVRIYSRGSTECRTCYLFMYLFLYRTHCTRYSNSSKAITVILKVQKLSQITYASLCLLNG